MVTAKAPGPALVLLMMNSDWVPARLMALNFSLLTNPYRFGGPVDEMRLKHKA